MSEDNTFEKIESRVITFMHSDETFLLEKVHVGGGKTNTTLKTLESLDFNWIYLAPFHNVVDDNLKLSTVYNYNYLHLKSRAKVCQVDVYREIAENHIDIRPICDNSCPLKETTCPYYETKRQLYEIPRSWAGVHHHLKDFLKEFFNIYISKRPMREYYEVLVIDENPINVLFENKTADPISLTNLKEVILKLNMTHAQLDKVLDLIDYLTLAFYNKNPLDYFELLKRFKEIDWSSFYDQYQQLLVEEIRHERIPMNRIPKEYIRMFGTMTEQMTEEKIPYMIIKSEKSPYNKKKFHFLYFDNSSLLSCPIKIIGLDGTANLDLWQAITNRRPSLLEKKYTYKNIYQLRTTGNPAKNTNIYARYPLSSWIRHGKITTTGIKLCGLIDKICSRKKHDVLIATTKPLKPYIEDNIKSKNVMFCNYYYVRSRNEFYNSCDTIILASEPNVQEFQIDAFAALSQWDKEKWRQIFTQEEMKQTVGRIRENKNLTETKRVRDEREIYIFPHTPPTNDINDHRPLYGESKIVAYTDIILGQHDLKNKTYKLIQANQSVHLKDVYDEFKIPRSFAKKLLTDLEKEGLIIDEGRKGYYLNTRIS